MKIRFIEPGNLPYRRSVQNLFVYDKYIRTPSQGLTTLATIVRNRNPDDDVLMYSESISEVVWSDVMDADLVFIGIFTFSARRGYEIADRVRQVGRGVVAIGGLHATLCPEEAAAHADYVLLGEADETIGPFVDAIRSGGIPDFAGVGRMDGGALATAGIAPAPHDIDTVPDRNLLYRFKKMAGHNTIWPQVHASRGCPHSCDYCALVAAFGRGVRTRSPESVIEDIRQAIDFFDAGHRRLAKMLWITDDNFFADRAWAMRVLRLIISEGIRYNFTVQARYEVGFDDEMLDLLAQAGFSELSFGIEFLEDEAFETYHKKSTVREVERAIANVQAHGLRVRGLFIVGADNHTRGVGERLARFVEEHGIQGVLIQSMYFVPGTPVYETHKDALIETDGWSRCVGKVVHRPKLLSPCELQQEIIDASRAIYAPRKLASAIFRKHGVERILFIGEYFWQRSVRADLRRDMARLREMEAAG